MSDEAQQSSSINTTSQSPDANHATGESGNPKDSGTGNAAGAARWRDTKYRRAVEKAGERAPDFSTSSSVEVQQLSLLRGLIPSAMMHTTLDDERSPLGSRFPCHAFRAITAID